MTKKLIKNLLVCLCIICFNANFALAEHTTKVKNEIIQTAIKMGVDPYVVLSIAKLESNFDHRKKNQSGAVGVFQLMPRTAKVLGVNPYVLNENIKGGVLYYSKMYKMYGSMDLALAAYNAGPGNVKKYKGVPPFRETKKFISSVKTEYHAMKANPTVTKLVEPKPLKAPKSIIDVSDKQNNVSIMQGSSDLAEAI